MRVCLGGRVRRGAARAVQLGAHWRYLGGCAPAGTHGARSRKSGWRHGRAMFVAGPLLGPPPPQLLPRPPPRLPIAYTVPLSIHQTQLLTCCSTNYHEAFRPRRQHCAWHQAHRYESHRARAARLHRPHDDVQDALGRAVLIRLSRIGRLASKVDIPQTGTRPFSVAHCITKP